MVLTILIAAVSGAAVLLIILGITNELVNRGDRINTRLNRYGSREQVQWEVGPAKAKFDKDKLTSGLNKMLQGQSFGAKLQRTLARADIKLTVTEFLFIQAGAVTLGALAGFVIFGSPIFSLGFGVLGFFGPKFYVNFRRKGRLKAFNSQLDDSIALLANSLRSGYSMLQSMELVSREAQAPVSTEFERVVREVGLGLSPEEALSNLTVRMQSDDLDLMVTAINVQREVGGNLAEILDTISHTIRDRVKMKGEVKVLTAQGTISGYVITGLPIGLSLILYIINPKYMSALWTTTCGWIMMAVSLVMITIGFFIIRKMVKIEI